MSEQSRVRDALVSPDARRPRELPKVSIGLVEASGNQRREVGMPKVGVEVSAEVLEVAENPIRT